MANAVRNEHGITDKAEAFARAYVENNGKATEAAIEAGYSGHSAKTIASQLLAQQRIRDRIHAITREVFTLAGAEALGVMLDLMRNAKSSFVRYHAAKDLLDRAGHKPLETLLTLNASEALNERDLMERIERIKAQLQLSGQRPVASLPQAMPSGRAEACSSDILDLPATQVADEG